jgi:hypothetical protein
VLNREIEGAAADVAVLDDVAPVAVVPKFTCVNGGSLGTGKFLMTVTQPNNNATPSETTMTISTTGTTRSRRCGA